MCETSVQKFRSDKWDKAMDCCKLLKTNMMRLYRPVPFCRTAGQDLAYSGCRARMNRMFPALLAIFIVCVSAMAQTRDFANWVNPFIGTGGHGHTFPGATMPFGMVQLSPDTRIDNWDGSSGYHYSDDIIYGFSHTHLSGTGIPDGCDILFMPTVDEREKLADQPAKDGEPGYSRYASRFSHANEKAEPGYYSVRINDGKLLAELTATTRVGMHRYTFPKSEDAGIYLDMLWRDKTLETKLKAVSNRRIEGQRRSKSWAKDQTVFFVAEFSKPFIGKDSRATQGSEDPDIGVENYFFPYTTIEGEQILLKVAISYVSIEGARKNLETELPGWDFDKVRADAKAAWNKELGKIEVSGVSEEQTTNFYTALYHTMVQPNIFSDVNGQYRGHDGKVHQLPNRRDAETQIGKEGEKSISINSASPRLGGEKSEQYSVFSLWDTFRAAHPLYTIIDQKRTVDFINTFIRQYEQGGRLPVWELWGEETDTMIGYHAVSVIADAMAKGIKGFDYEKAYKAAKHSAELDHFGLAGYKKRGYISMEDENESVSRTLEYAYNDWCLFRMAVILNKMTLDDRLAKTTNRPHAAPRQDLLEDSRRYLNRARYFENLFDTKTGFFRAKKNGGFVEPFSPTEVNFGFTEGNSWQYSFFVPHDVAKLMQLMGGRQKFVAKLDELFTTSDKLSGREQADLTGLIGQYAHGNEPSHHIAYLYNYAGEPWKTQKYVRQIMDNFYKNAPDGLIGNEDCGQMSAWYILSASGFYPVAPGDGVYALGSPLFSEIKYRLENGKTFTVRAKNLSAKNIYIDDVRLNGVSHKKAFINHADVMRGGNLEFTMTPEPSKTAFTEFPVSSVRSDLVAVPVITAERTFADTTTVTISTLTPNAAIHYTTNGSDPYPDEPGKGTRVYKGPFVVDRTVAIRAVAISPLDNMSFPVDAVLTKRPNDWSVKVLSGYSTQYSGGGESGIIDGIRGTTNFASGEWQGIQGKPYEALIDLKRETPIREVGGGFLQVAGPWIWMPQRVEFEVSMDGTSFRQIAVITPEFPVTEMKPTHRTFTKEVAVRPAAIQARYLRIKAFNFGKIPSWHLGAGGDPWIFIDEIIIR
jgi:putative alpha-1,2-mannosidase